MDKPRHSRSWRWLIVAGARAILVLVLLVGIAWATFLIVGCSGGTTIRPASTHLSRTTTRVDERGKPVTETVSGSTTGPSITSDSPKALELEAQTPPLEIPGSRDDAALTAGSGRSSVSGTFGKAAPVWGLWLIGLALCGGGGFVAVRFAKLTLGATMIGAGAFIIAATFYPLLWIGAALCGLGYVGWTVWDARQHAQDQTALTVVAGAVDAQDQPVTVDLPDGSKVVRMVNATKSKIATAATGMAGTVEAAIGRAKARLKK